MSRQPASALPPIVHACVSSSDYVKLVSFVIAPQVVHGRASSGFRWNPRSFVMRLDDVVALESEIARITPSNATLLGWASRPESQPPQSWYDECSDPFADDADSIG